MFKKIAFLILISALSKSLFSQDTLLQYSSPKFSRLELKTGIAMNMGVIPLNITYQKNIKKNLGAILFSEFGVPSPFINTPGIYIKSTYFHWIEAIGIGGTFGKKRFNNSIYLVGGGKYYYSNLTVQENIHEPTLITSKIMPEIGFLYNLKIGKKKFYFTTQLYIPLYPYQMLIKLENNTTLTMGAGYKFGVK
jgi:hypothetical protein